jgi:heptosyltransferase-1
LKEWPLSHSGELARRILADFPDARIVASASSQAREQERLRLLVEDVDDARLIRLPAKVALPQLAAALQRCCLHIGPDSGVMNLASAMGTPTISFFRAQPGYKAWVPNGENHHAFIAPCHCIDHADAPCAKQGIAECLASISVNQVVREIKRAQGSS